MLIFLAICCFIEAFIQLSDLHPDMTFGAGLAMAVTLFIWIMMGITFIKLYITIQKTADQEAKINNLEAQLDYIKKHLKITDEQIEKYVIESNEFDIDYGEDEMEELNKKAEAGMSKEEIDKLPYFDPTNSDEDNT